MRLQKYAFDLSTQLNFTSLQSRIRLNQFSGKRFHRNGGREKNNTWLTTRTYLLLNWWLAFFFRIVILKNSFQTHCISTEKIILKWTLVPIWPIVGLAITRLSVCWKYIVRLLSHCWTVIKHFWKNQNEVAILWTDWI